MILRNSTFTVSVQGSFQVLSNVTVEQDATFVEHYKAMIQADAINKMESELGVGSLGPDTTSVIEQEIENSKDNIIAQVNNVLSSSSADVAANGDIEIVIIDDLIMDGVRMDASVQVQLTVQSAMSSAQEMARDVVSSLMAQASGQQESQHSTEQMAELAEALGEANRRAIEAQNEGHANALEAMGMGGIFRKIGPIVLLLVVGAVALKFLPMLLAMGMGYDPVKCQGYKRYEERFTRYSNLTTTYSILIKVWFAVTFVRTIMSLLKEGLIIFQPWKWNDSNKLERYFIRLIMLFMFFCIFCMVVHLTPNPFTCIAEFKQHDENNCEWGQRMEGMQKMSAGM